MSGAGSARPMRTRRAGCQVGSRAAGTAAGADARAGASTTLHILPRWAVGTHSARTCTKGIVEPFRINRKYEVHAASMCQMCKNHTSYLSPSLPPSLCPSLSTCPFVSLSLSLSTLARALHLSSSQPAASPEHPLLYMPAWQLGHNVQVPDELGPQPLKKLPDAQVLERELQALHDRLLVLVHGDSS